MPGAPVASCLGPLLPSFSQAEKQWRTDACVCPLCDVAHDDTQEPLAASHRVRKELHHLQSVVNRVQTAEEDAGKMKRHLAWSQPAAQPQHSFGQCYLSWHSPLTPRQVDSRTYLLLGVKSTFWLRLRSDDINASVLARSERFCLLTSDSKSNNITP